MELRHKKEDVKREMNGKEAEKPKPLYSRKAPLVAGLVAATALALGACSVRDEKPVENKKGELVTESDVKAKTMKAEVFMSEVEVPVETKTTTQTVKEGDVLPLEEAGPAAISLKVTKISKEGVELALEVETAFEQEGYFEHWMTVPYGKSVRTGERILFLEIKAEKGGKAGEAVVTVKMVAPKEDGDKTEKPKTDAEAFLDDFGGPDEWGSGNIPGDCIPTKISLHRERIQKGELLDIADILAEITEVNEDGIKIHVVGLADLHAALPRDGPTFELPYGKVLTDNFELMEHKIKKGKKANEIILETSVYDCGENDIAPYKMTVKEGDRLPIGAGTSFRDIRSPEVTKIDEEGIEITWWNAEALPDKEIDTGTTERIPYGKSLKTGECALAWEVKAEKGKNPGEAIVTVKTTILKEVEVKKEVPVETKTITKMVKEGDDLPTMWMGTDFRHMQTAKVAKIDEKGIEVAWTIETAFEKAGFLDFSMKIPYGESRKTGEGALTWEVKAEKGKKPGEAVVSVKYPDFSE